MLLRVYIRSRNTHKWQSNPAKGEEKGKQNRTNPIIANIVAQAIT